MIPAFLKAMPVRYLAEEDKSRTGSACLAVLDPKDLVPAARAFLAADWHLEDVSGLMSADGAVSVYHFDKFDAPDRVTLLVVVPYGAGGGAEFPSIASVYQGAEWHERETRDFYGFAYAGNPNFVPLLLPDDMDAVHPLYKEENARAPLHVIFSAPERVRKVVSKADGFTLLDAPVKEEAAKAEPAAEAPAGPAPKAKAAAVKPAEDSPADKKEDSDA